MNALTVQQNAGLQPRGFEESLLENFIKYTDVKETTMKGYAVCLRQFMRWIGERGITNPQRADIKDYKAHLEAQDFTAGTRAQYLRAVKHFFKWTASEGLYPNVADNIKGAKVKQDNTKKEAFRESDIKAILDGIDTSTEAGKRDYILVLLSVTGALRIIEMQRANVGDLQTIKGQKVLYIQGKGHDEKDDYIKIVPELEARIDEYLQTRPQPVKKNDPLFTGAGNRAKGARLTEPSISRIIKGVFVAAGYDCDKLTAHSLRHTSNTILFKTGADLYTVQQHARHLDPKTTEIYLHANNKEADRSEERIYNQIFNPDTPDTEQSCIAILRTLPASMQESALEYLKQLQASCTTTAALTDTEAN